MRARITLAFVAVIALAVLLAGGGALLLVRHSQSIEKLTNVRQAASTLTRAVQGKNGTDFAKADVIDVIRQIAQLSETVVEVDKNGHLLGNPPNGIPGPVFESQGKTLVATGQASGIYHGTAWGAGRLLTTTGGTVIALVFEAKEDFSSEYYVLFAGAVALVFAAILAALISRRIATRVVRVARAAEHIADGDFGVRLAGRRRDYPEIAQLDRAINSMAEDLARARAQEREFLLSISHDLRTPLTSIRGYSEAIADGAVEEPARAAGVVVSEAERLERLIGDLLDLARLRSRQFTLEPTVVDLAGEVATATNALQVAFDGEGVALEIIAPEWAVTATADPHRLAQIVANLLENALKYAARRVTVTIAVTGGFGSIEVADDGPGIDPEDLPHVLERLYTSNRHPARSAGTGLGLAIVSELADAMDGAVLVESPIADHHGTRVTLTLPRPAGIAVGDG